MATKDVYIPVLLPTANGASDYVIGKATLDEGTLTVFLDETFPAQAIQRMIDKGRILGITFVMIEEEKKD